MSANRRIKILHLIRSIGYGGAENQVVNILNGLNKEKFDKYLITIKHHEKPNYRKLDSEIKYEVIGRKKFGHIFFIIRLWKFVKNNEIDIIQAHLFQSNFFAAIVGLFSKNVVVFSTEHGKNLWKKLWHHKIERFLITPFVYKRIAVSNDIKKIRIKTRDIKENKIIVIPPCVNSEAKIIKYKEKANLKIISVGRLVEAKNYSMLIDAFEILINKKFNVSLTIVGDGPEYISLKSKIENKKLNDYVLLTGYKSNVIKLLNNFDIFAISSIREGIPVAMLEAMACGLPVVATNVGGIPDVLEDNNYGIIVDSNDKHKMAQAFIKLVEDSNLRKYYGLMGPKKIDQFYSQKTICKEYENLYEKSLKKR